MNLKDLKTLARALKAAKANDKVIIGIASAFSLSGETRAHFTRSAGLQQKAAEVRH